GAARGAVDAGAGARRAGDADAGGGHRIAALRMVPGPAGRPRLPVTRHRDDDGRGPPVLIASGDLDAGGGPMTHDPGPFGEGQQPPRSDQPPPPGYPPPPGSPAQGPPAQGPPAQGPPAQGSPPQGSP